MNTGAFGENFPYSNFHDLNMDWLIKIAKDFLDQYTNIQETIQTGLDDLDAKATELEGLLQEWYDTHSEDIANQLATALEALNEWYTEHEGYLDQALQDNINAFNTAAEQKAQQTIASIPDDYTTLFNSVFIFRNTIDPTTYNNHLYEKHDPGLYYIPSGANFTDRPVELETGLGVQLAITLMANSIIRQDYTNAWGQTRTRLISASDNTFITSGTRADTYGWFSINDMWHGTANPTSYNNLISNISNLGWYYISGSAGFTDRPTELETGIGANLFIEPFGGTLVKQTYFDGQGKNRTRIIDTSNSQPYTTGLYTDTNGWFFNDNAFTFRGAISAQNFNNKLSDLIYTSVYYIGSTQGFTDRPTDLQSGIGAMIEVVNFASTIVKQTYFDAQGHCRIRLVLTSTKEPYTTGLITDANGWFSTNFSRWECKTLVTFGDSRTWYDGHTYTNLTKPEYRGQTCVGYQQQIRKLSGMYIVNEGVSGDSSIDICKKIRSYDLSNADAVLLAGGVNDWLQGLVAAIGTLEPIGSNFNTETVYGAWQSAIEYIMTNYPKVKIYILTPAIAWNEGNIMPYSYPEIKKNIAELYNLPILDLYKVAGITTINKNTFYADDSTTGWHLHFNDDGNKLIGEIIAEYINTH